MAKADAVDGELAGFLAEMVTARTFSTRLFNLQRQGRIGTVAPIDGAEAVVVGSAAALDPETDWVIPQYREKVGLGRFGEDVIDRHLLYLFGHPAGGHLPERTRVFPTQISLATQIPHAVGLAWGLRLRGEPGTVLVFFGDGASSEGDFYEAANLAGVLSAPVIFLCNNNGWAISTPVTQQTAAKALADKAVGAGIPGVTVDGTDVLAVRDAVAEARERAVAGAGPSLVECVAFRLGPHTTADDPTRYVPAGALEEAQQSDPVDRLRQQLTDRGLWDDDRHDEVVAAADARMDLAIERADQVPLAPDAFFDHVYAEPTPRMQRQRAELLARVDRD